MKKLPFYVAILGGFLVLLEILEILVGYFLLGLVFTAGLPSDPTSLFTQIVIAVLYPESAPVYSMPLIMISAAFMMVRIIVLAVVVGSVIKLALDSYTSEGGELGASISTSFTRFIPMVIAILVINVITGALAAPGNAMASYATQLVDLETLEGFEELVNAFALTVALGIPVIFLVARLAPIYAVITTEDVSVSEAFSRAFDLTRGSFIHVAAGWFLLSIVTSIFDLGIGAVAVPLIMIFGDPVGTILYNLLSLVLLTPMYFIFFAVLYKDLESRQTVADQTYW
jgi:hypothetical protein